MLSCSFIGVRIYLIIVGCCEGMLAVLQELKPRPKLRNPQTDTVKALRTFFTYPFIIQLMPLGALRLLTHINKSIFLRRPLANGHLRPVLSRWTCREMLIFVHCLIGRSPNQESPECI